LPCCFTPLGLLPGSGYRESSTSRTNKSVRAADGTAMKMCEMRDREERSQTHKALRRANSRLEENISPRPGLSGSDSTRLSASEVRRTGRVTERTALLNASKPMKLGGCRRGVGGSRSGVREERACRPGERRPDGQSTLQARVVETLRSVEALRKLMAVPRAPPARRLAVVPKDFAAVNFFPFFSAFPTLVIPCLRG